MPGYEFLTTWVLEAPRERVWDAIRESEKWPEWWRGVERVVEVERGDDEGIGQLSRYTWRSKLPYELEFEMRTTRVERPRLLEGQASGELSGIGRWRLYEEDGTTAVIYEWNVATTKRWMNAVAPLLRPAFEWNHDWVMGHGGTGLARLLGCRLVTAG
jgi:polyketide cyclase/dehydrase/lipid transport protein